MYAAIVFKRGKAVRAFGATRVEAATTLASQVRMPSHGNLTMQTARAGYGSDGELRDTGSDIRWVKYDRDNGVWVE